MLRICCSLLVQTVFLLFPSIRVPHRYLMRLDPKTSTIYSYNLPPMSFQKNYILIYSEFWFVVGEYQFTEWYVIIQAHKSRQKQLKMKKKVSSAHVKNERKQWVHRSEKIPLLFSVLAQIQTLPGKRNTESIELKHFWVLWQHQNARNKKKNKDMTSQIRTS